MSFLELDNVIQMNLLAGTTDNPEAFGEAFNVAVGGRNTLNELYKLIVDNLNESLALNADTPVVKTKEGCLITNNELPITKEAIYRDFRAGDIRHSNANISKAQNFVGYAPTHDIYQGMEEAIEWYIESIGQN